jgi:hypothetical protein
VTESIHTTNDGANPSPGLNSGPRNKGIRNLRDYRMYIREPSNWVHQRQKRRTLLQTCVDHRKHLYFTGVSRNPKCGMPSGSSF